MVIPVKQVSPYLCDNMGKCMFYAFKMNMYELPIKKKDEYV